MLAAAVLHSFVLEVSPELRGRMAGLTLVPFSPQRERNHSLWITLGGINDNDGSD